MDNNFSTISSLVETIEKNQPASDEFMNTKIIQPLNQLFNHTWRNIYSIYGQLSAERTTDFNSTYRRLNHFDIFNTYEESNNFTSQTNLVSNVEFDTPNAQFMRVKRDKVAVALLDSVGICQSRNRNSQFKLSLDSKLSNYKPKQNKKSFKNCVTIRPIIPSKYSKRMTALSPSDLQRSINCKLNIITEKKLPKTVAKPHCKIEKYSDRLQSMTSPVKPNANKGTLQIKDIDSFISEANKSMKKIRKVRRSYNNLKKVSSKSESISNMLTEEIGGYSEKDKMKLTTMFKKRNPLFIYGNRKPHYVSLQVKPNYEKYINFQ